MPPSLVLTARSTAEVGSRIYSVSTGLRYTSPRPPTCWTDTESTTHWVSVRPSVRVMISPSTELMSVMERVNRSTWLGR